MSSLLRNAVVESLAALTRGSAAQISDADDLVDDLGVDSMAAIHLIMAIEDRLGRTLPEGCEPMLAGARTVGELTERLTSVLAAAPGNDTAESVGRPG
jgi:acyl carrier protein